MNHIAEPWYLGKLRPPILAGNPWWPLAFLSSLPIQLKLRGWGWAAHLSESLTDFRGWKCFSALTQWIQPQRCHLWVTTKIFTASLLPSGRTSYICITKHIQFKIQFKAFRLLLKVLYSYIHSYIYSHVCVCVILVVFDMRPFIQNCQSPNPGFRKRDLLLFLRTI